MAKPEVFFGTGHCRIGQVRENLIGLANVARGFALQAFGVMFAPAASDQAVPEASSAAPAASRSCNGPDPRQTGLVEAPDFQAHPSSSETGHGTMPRAATSALCIRP